MVRYSLVSIILIFFLFGNYDFNDLKEAIVYYGNTYLFAGHIFINSVIVIFLLIGLIFGGDIIQFIKKYKVKPNF